MRLATHIALPSYSKDERLQRRIFSLASNDVKRTLSITMGESFSHLFKWELAFDDYLKRQYAAKDAAQPLRSWFAGSPTELYQWFCWLPTTVAETKWQQLPPTSNSAKVFLEQFRLRTSSTAVPRDCQVLLATLRQPLVAARAPPPSAGGVRSAAPVAGGVGSATPHGIPGVLTPGSSRTGNDRVVSAWPAPPPLPAHLTTTTMGSSPSGGLTAASLHAASASGPFGSALPPHVFGTSASGGAVPAVPSSSHGWGMPAGAGFPPPSAPNPSPHSLGPHSLAPTHFSAAPGPIQTAAEAEALARLASLQDDVSRLQHERDSLLALERQRVHSSTSAVVAPPPLSAISLDTQLRLDGTSSRMASLQNEVLRLRASHTQGIAPTPVLHLSADPDSVLTPDNPSMVEGSRHIDRKLTGVEFLDDDKKKHIVFRPSAAYDNAPHSNFIRRMTDPIRLVKGMSGEGLLLDATKYRQHLLGQARSSNFGIVSHDPAWATEYELSRVASLPVIRSAAEFEKLLQGKIDTLSSFLESGTMSNLAQLERCLKNIEHVLVAVFDRQWAGCNSVVLAFLQTPAMRLIPTGFPVTYLEMAISTFNRLVTEKYLPHLAAPTHPSNLASVPNVILLWKALIDPMVTTCGDPIQLNVYYRLYGFNAGLGRVPSKADRNLLSTWDTVADTGPRGILKRSTRPAESDTSSVASTSTTPNRKRKNKSASSRKGPSVDFQDSSAAQTSGSQTPKRPASPPAKSKAKGSATATARAPAKVKSEAAASAPRDYCIQTILSLLKLGGPCSRAAKQCRFRHVAARADIDSPFFLRQIATSSAKILTDSVREQLKAALEPRAGAVSE